MTGKPGGTANEERPEPAAGVDSTPAGGSPGHTEAGDAPAADAEGASETADRTPPTAAAAPGEGPAAVEADLNALVEEARSKADEYLDLAQRTKADFDNYRKRMTTENRAAAQRGRLDVVGTVIEAIDNLERVLDAAGIDRAEALEGELPGDAPVTEQGLIVAWRDLHAVLRKADVEPYSPEGEQFDPEWQEALQAIPAEDAEPGTVIEVMQRGYRSGETVLRAARVVVAQ